MKQLWKKFDKLTEICYMSELEDNCPQWDEAYEVFKQLVAQGREKDPQYAAEILKMDDATDFAYGVADWIEDYLDELDAREEQHQLKVLRQTKALYDRHLMGGLMYLEAVKIINKDPSLIREMGAFEISLFLWGIRHDCLNRETIFRFADLVLRMHVYHGQCLHAMIEMCSLYETKNLLSAVLHLLILGEKKDPIYHQDAGTVRILYGDTGYEELQGIAGSGTDLFSV